MCTETEWDAPQCSIESYLVTALSPDEWRIVTFSLETALGATVLLLVPGIALAWLLARREFAGKTFIESLLTLPIVLPPVATGLVLLHLVGRRGALGGWMHDATGTDIVFTWRAVVLAMAVMSLPLLTRTARLAFEGVPARLETVARTLGASEWHVFRTITLPLAARGVLAGTVLAFARALGEFGATVMVAGILPGRTETLSLAIFQRIQLGDDPGAMRLVVVAVLLAFAATYGAELLQHRHGPRFR